MGRCRLPACAENDVRSPCSMHEAFDVVIFVYISSGCHEWLAWYLVRLTGGGRTTSSLVRLAQSFKAWIELVVDKKIVGCANVTWY